MIILVTEGTDLWGDLHPPKNGKSEGYDFFNQISFYINAFICFI